MVAKERPKEKQPCGKQYEEAAIVPAISDDSSQQAKKNGAKEIGHQPQSLVANDVEGVVYFVAISPHNKVATHNFILHSS